MLPRPLPLVCLALGVCCAGAADAPDSPLDAARKSAEAWVRLRDESARLETEWRSQRELTAATVDALEARARELEGQRDQLRSDAAPQEKLLREVESNNQAAAQDLQAGAAKLRAVSRRLQDLRPSLPPRLSEALSFAFKTLENPQASDGDRVQWTLTILGRCAAFDRTVDFAREAIAVPGSDNRRMAEVLYLGLARGYALDRSHGQAWVGMPGPGGWAWTEHPEAAAGVAHLIDVYLDKTSPGYSAVPVQIAHPLTPGTGAQP